MPRQPEASVTSTHPNRDSGRVLQFRPRARGSAHNLRFSPVNDLRQYESAGGSDDFGHRMMMNLIAAVIVLILVGCGLWLTDAMVKVRKAQDCVLSGRLNCLKISVPGDAR
jgi:hypothetical protein